MNDQDHVETVDKIRAAVGHPVHFHYPRDEGDAQGVLSQRTIMYSPGSTGVPYWDVVDLIHFDGHAEPWMRIGYYRRPASGLVWGSQTTITEPLSIWRNLLISAATEMDWFHDMLVEVMSEIQSRRAASGSDSVK